MYTGEAIEPLEVIYSDGWKGGSLEIVYTDNVNPGTASGCVSIGNASASLEFMVTPAEVPESNDGTEDEDGAVIEPEEDNVTTDGTKTENIEAETPADDSAKTGDDSKVWILWIVLAVAGVGLLGICIKGRKK